MLTAELLDMALQALVDIESDIPCDAMANADNFCEDFCMVKNDEIGPNKECWLHYLEGEWKNDRLSAVCG